jgi:serine protease
MIRHHLPARRLAVLAVTALLVSGMTGIARAGTGHGDTAPPGSAAGAGLVRGAGSSNPYAPSYRHPYRFGAVATRQAQAQMEAYRARHPSTGAGAVPNDGPLQYGGGPVVSGPPRVYLVFWGRGWGVFHYDTHGDHTFTRDPFAGAPKLQELFKGLGTGGELWSGVMTQYCQGVTTGATSCANTDTHVSYPTNGVLAGVLYDDIAAPVNATADQIGGEAVRSAQIFGNTTAGANHDAQYVILSPTGYHPDGFGPTSSWCAWHGDVNSSYGPVVFTNLPYVMDRGQACGTGLINGSSGALDGYTLDAGHEYAETLTDPLPTSGWDDPVLGNEGENTDKCASSLFTLGGNVTTATGTFALPATWSNDIHWCTMSHAVLPIRTAVPDVVGATLTRAGQALTAAGLIRGTVSTVVDCANVGLITAQHPAPRTVVPVGVTVTLTLGANPKPPLHCQ